METAKLVVDLIGKLIWPIVVMTIILIFRKHIIKLLPHIKKVKAVGVELTIDKIEGIVEEALDSKYKEANAPENFKKIVYQEEETTSPEKNDAGNSTMLAFTANKSFEENIKYKIYYDPVTRNHNFLFKYIGLYKKGKILAVGKLLKIVYCNYENGELVATNGDDLSRLTTDEYSRIKETIENTDYYDLEYGCKFFLVDNFFLTNYTKASDYPLRAKKYIWLDEVEEFKEGMKAEKLAELLDGKEWE